MLKEYLKDILNIAGRGDATEQSYYHRLKNLIETFATSIHRKGIEVTILPKKTEAGCPDFRVWDGRQRITGYIEAKNLSEENLDYVAQTEQIKRYLDVFPNFILTNFFSFKLYRNGRKIDDVQIARPYIFQLGKELKAIPVEREKEFLELLDKFFAFSFPKVSTAETLAFELAKRTRFLKEQILIEELKEEKNLIGFYDAFKKYLITELTQEQFADLYSQTITYGLFIARMRAENDFSRKLAFERIPHTIGILRDIFQFISLGELPPQLEASVDDISDVLRNTDVKEIFHKDYIEGKDPIVYFYEPFLKKYDPTIQEARGAYYTPLPVVSYIIRSLNIILKEYFNREGFIDSSVTVLDPAGGTLTFLAEVTKLAVEEFVSKYGEGGKREFIKEHILKNFYAFELMVAPYAVGHLKMAFLLEELGYKLEKDERVKLYLTNTLEMEEVEQITIPVIASLAQESRDAREVKKKTPILVILGNPPYSGHSYNRGKWISAKIREYYKVDGKPLGEKNPKWLQDDYVKFVRFAQWKIEQAGEGVLGFITNHSWLDNPTFRGMRQSLMNSFNEVYVLDLHGSSLKREKCPDGSKDENVFDIQQGVAITFFIKKKVGETDKNIVLPRVYHSDIWGVREEKYKQLLQNDVKSTKWNELIPKSSYYFFVHREEAYEEIYDKYWKVTDIFYKNSVGIVTARDNLTIQWTPEEVWSTVLHFSKIDSEQARLAYGLGKDTRDWKVKLAQKDLIDSGLSKEKITPILYRPFDIRYSYYTGKSGGFHCRPRPEVMPHMMKENLGLVTCRQQNTVGFYHAFVSNKIMESCVVSNKTREINYLFPLYLYKEKEPKKRGSHRVMMLFEPSADYCVRQANLAQELIEQLTLHYKKEPTPEEIFYYIYSILYSNIYRKKYAEFLRIDFPRIPFTKEYESFIKMGEFGKELVELHLMKAKVLDSPIAKFQGVGTEQVEKVKYDGKKVYINDTQYFDGIEKEVWEYQIGGYQVLDKWLKSRKDRSLNLEEIKHYCKIVTALKMTIGIQQEIDKIYLEVEKEVIPV